VTNKHLVEIVGRGGTGQTARLVIDGKDISSTVTSLRLDMNSRAAHSLTVDLCAFPVVAHLEGVKVAVDGDIAEVLKWLGWTPPPEEEEQADVLD
jgi:hypothetical protein